MQARTFIGISTALTLAVAGVWLFTRDAGPRIVKPAGGTTVVAFGDSLVEGVGSRNGGWVPLVASRIGIPIIPAGRSGDTTASALVRADDDLVAHDPRVTILLIGGNDALGRVSPAQVEQNLRSIIARARSTGGVVLLLGVRSGLLAQPYDDLFARVGEEEGVTYIPDILKGIFGHGDLMADTIHPNDAGYARMADRIAPILAEMVQPH